MRDALKPTALVTDVGSVKGSVDRDLAPLLDDRALWIGSHPMAGSEQAGFSAARATLFEGAPVIVTPTKHTQPDARERAVKFWTALGANVYPLTPERHDEIIAAISHLPHLAAAALVNVIDAKMLDYVGTGFRDATRIAIGSPGLWAEILLANRAAVIHSIDHLEKGLDEIKTALRDGNKSGLLEALQRAHDLRSQIPPRKS
jgi:prephenate dehydrogenase